MKALFFEISRTKTLSVIIMFCCSFVFSQETEIIWSKYFGGQNGEANSIQRTDDNGYIIAGESEDAHSEAIDYHGGSDGFVVKLDSNGDLEWSKCYGTDASEIIKTIKQTVDGGYIFIGYAAIANQYYDYWIVKIDNVGNIEWEKKYGGSDFDYAESIEITDSNEYIITGYTRSTDGDIDVNFGNNDYWILKLDSDGNLLSKNNYGGPRNDRAYASTLDLDGNLVIAGESFSYSGQVTCRNPSICESGFWNFKLDFSGNFVWERCFDGGNGSNYFNIPHSIIRTTDNGYMTVGRGRDVPNGNNGLGDFWLIKTDAFGNLQWKNSYGGSQHERALSVKQTLDGGYVVAGDSESDISSGDVVVNLGQHSQTNGWVIKTDSSGNLEWQRVIGSSNFGYDNLNDIIEVSIGDYIAVGRAGKSNDDCIDSNGRGFWLTKISSTSLGINKAFTNNVKIHPNPTTNGLINIQGSTNIDRIKIYSIVGKKVLEVNSENITKIDITSLPNGFYFLTLFNQNKSVTKKVILSR